VSTRTEHSRDQAQAAPAGRDRLAIEAQELRAAQQALRAGDNDRALALLEQQDAHHPSGALAQERQAARVMALCQSQQVALARREAARFEARFPGSPLLGKVRGACRGR
jgi:outer membrane protein assembly factor BamD (BamD/ComL family)